MKQYRYTIDEAAYDVTICSIRGQKAQVEVNGIPFEVEMHGSQLSEERLPDVEAPQTSQAPLPSPQGGKAQREEVGGNAASPQGATEGGQAGDGTPVKAPLPGVVTKVNVSVGQTVKKGEAVLVLEAMKMENNITAEQDGTVTGICVKPGESVLEGATLLTIA